MTDHASIEIARGARFTFDIPEGASTEAPDALPTLELGPLHGARVVYHAGWFGGFGLARVACASAPTSGWAPGVEDLVLGRATQMTVGALRDDAGEARLGLQTKPILHVDTAANVATPFGFEQRFEGDASTKPLLGKHVLAFAEEGDVAFLCSIACVESSAAAHDACAAWVDSAHAEGALAAPPAPNVFVRGVFLAAEHPTSTVLVCAAIYVAAVVLILARRPRTSRAT